MFDAVIFDCDGTLVDSETLGNSVIVECCREIGLAITLDDALTHFAGRKMAETIDLIALWHGKPLPPDFLKTIRRRMALAFEDRLQPMPGVHALLERLIAPKAVASNGPAEKMEITLRVTGLLPFFEGRIFSAYQCDSWKPEPGLFLFAAAQMGVDPHRCAVIEDSPLGIRAAVRANMQAFGYAPSGDGAELKALGATVFHHMETLLPHLQVRD